MTSRSHGYTLVEMLVVVGILAVAAAAIVAFATAASSSSLSSATDSVASDLLYAQNVAITTHKKTYVVFTPGNGSNPDKYELQSDTGAVINRPGHNSGSVTMGCGKSDHPGAKLGLTGPLKIGFDASGQPFQVTGSTETPITSATKISLKGNSNNQAYSLQIQPFTGEITANNDAGQ